MSVLDKDGVIVLGDSVTPSNNITLKTPAVADGSLEVYQGVPGNLGAKLFSFDPTNADFNDKTKSALNASGGAPIFACRAWLDINGLTGEVRASGNISSVIKTGTGQYVVNFITPMPDTSYACAGVNSSWGQIVTDRSPSSFTLVVFNTATGTAFDSPHVDLIIVR